MPDVAAVILAAGLSRRWGPGNKLLAKMDGVPMIRRTAEAVLGSRIRPVIVVTGHEPRLIEQALAGLPVSFAHAADYAQGMSASLKAAIEALPAACAGALICLGDMPRVRPGTLNALAGAFSGQDAVLPSYNGERGNPVLLGRALFADIRKLAGDKGARALLAGVRVTELPVDDPGILQDFDSPDALACSA